MADTAKSLISWTRILQVVECLCFWEFSKKYLATLIFWNVLGMFLEIFRVFARPTQTLQHYPSLCYTFTPAHQSLLGTSLTFLSEVCAILWMVKYSGNDEVKFNFLVLYWKNLGYHFEYFHLVNVKVRPHYAAWQNATQCGFATRQKLLNICRKISLVHIKKKKHFADYISVYKNCRTKNTETRTHHMPCQKLCLATVDGKYQCGKPLMIPTPCRSNFHAARHSATCCDMQKPCRSHATLTST